MKSEYVNREIMEAIIQCPTEILINMLLVRDGIVTIPITNGENKPQTTIIIIQHDKLNNKG